MNDVLLVFVFLFVGVLLAAVAWRKLEAEEHDVLHTHPKLVVALIVCGTLILGVQAVAVRYGAQALNLVESAVNPEGEVAQRAQKAQVVVVADIESVSVAAAACAQSHEGFDAIRTCVVNELDKRGSPPVISKE